MAKKNYHKRYFINSDEVDENNYIDKMIEWQEHQYDPGYYTGDRIPPVYTHPGRPAWLGWLFVIFAIVFGISILFIVLIGFGKGQLLEKVFIISMALSILSLQFIIGVRLIKKGRKVKRDHVRKRLKIWIFITICLSLLICTLLISIYVLNNHVEEFAISEQEQIITKQSGEVNFVYINPIQKNLKCSIEDYYVLWSMDIGDDSHINNTSYKIIYKWNNMNPHKGIIMSIEKVPKN